MGVVRAQMMGIIIIITWGGFMAKVMDRTVSTTTWRGVRGCRAIRAQVAAHGGAPYGHSCVASPCAAAQSGVPTAPPCRASSAGPRRTCGARCVCSLTGPQIASRCRP